MADDLKALEKRISREYTTATAELKQKAENYFSAYQKRWQEEYKAYKAGKYTASEWKAWQIAQIGRGDHWNELKDQMAQRMTESKEIASGYINDTLPKAYTKESNSVASLAKASAMDQGVAGIRFDIVDESTVRNLMLNKDNVISFRTTSINPVRDYKWNSERIQSALLQGILQGDSIDKIADRFLSVMENNRASAIRNARTAVTSARSAGKQDRFNDLAKQGCEMTKIWIATGDERTRDAHRDADGQEVPYDQPFIVGGEEMMYPCDSSGSPANVYNCRCTMQTGKIRFHSVLTKEQQELDNGDSLIEINHRGSMVNKTTDESKEIAERASNNMASIFSVLSDEPVDIEWAKGYEVGNALGEGYLDRIIINAKIFNDKNQEYENVIAHELFHTTQSRTFRILRAEGIDYGGKKETDNYLFNSALKNASHRLNMSEKEIAKVLSNLYGGGGHSRYGGDSTEMGAVAIENWYNVKFKGSGNHIASVMGEELINSYTDAISDRHYIKK